VTIHDLFGADPNFTLGMDSDRYLTHTRGECSPETPCALCRAEVAEDALAEARAERDRLRAFADAVLALCDRVQDPQSWVLRTPYSVADGVRRLAAEHGIEGTS
jgi:hypothetical protein